MRQLKKTRRKTALQRFASDRAGNVAIIFSLSLLPAVGAAGGAVDFAVALAARSQLQAAVDAAALAGASKEKTESAKRELANATFKANLAAISALAAVEPTITVSGNEITVSAQYATPAALTAALGMAHIPVKVTASALQAGGVHPCVVALSPSGTSLSLNSHSEIEAPNCAVAARSSSREALHANSASHVSASLICLEGGFRLNSRSTATPHPQTDCADIEDPLASLPVPAEVNQPCDHTDVTVQGTAELSPGIYCKKLLLNSGARVTFKPGVYILKDAIFEVNSGSRAVGDGVFFHFTGEGDYLKVNSGSIVEFKAPRTGPYAGVVFSQERAAQSDIHILNSGSQSYIEGTVYFPGGALMINSGSETGDRAAFTAYVVDRLELNSSSALRLNADYDLTDVPLPDGLKATTFGGTVRLSS
jgi:Flp pilus assembly protein TadG